MQGLRFALLFDGNFLERWHLRCLEHLEQSAELAGVILNDGGQRSTAGETASALMRFYAKHLDDRRAVNVASRFADLKTFHRADAPERIKSGDFDFVLKLGRGSTPTGIEMATRHGIWFFQHETEGDLLPFFREVYDAEDVTQAVLLARRAPGGEAAILEQGYFRTEKRSYVDNRDRVLESIAEWPARVCRRLLERANGDSFRCTATAVPSSSSPQRPPRLLRFWARIVRRRLLFAWQRLLRHPQWNIGVLHTPVGTLLRPGAYADREIEWFPLESRESFLADPFGLMRDGTVHILCEYFGYRSERGHVCTLAYSDHGFTQPEPAIRLPVHMSYPFLIEDAGEIYCVPETCHAEEMALFRAVEFPRRWSKIAVLVERFSGVDPTVFRHDGRWWLMCTERGRDADASLWIWHAAELLGPWTAHARNPVKTDVRSARPGGAPFVHGGVLYRPAQDCSKVYGWRIVIQRVKRLTASEFVEEPVAVLEASKDSPFPLGRHTLTPVGDVVLIDGHRAVFVWLALRSFLRIWARDLLNKLRRRRPPSPAPG